MWSDAARSAIILLGAGASSRMRGTDKLLHPVRGQPLLRHCALQAMLSRAGRVIVVIPDDNPARREAIEGLDVTVVNCPDWRNGIAASIRAGMQAVTADCDAVVITLADMPDLTHAHFDALLAAFDPAGDAVICRATAAGGQPGNPVLFARSLFGQLTGLQGDSGARALIASLPDRLRLVPTPGQGAITDLDTPEDWARWQAMS
jgi:molybdenum cofactor cytidylyltransferase